MKEKMYYEQLGYDFDPPFYSSTSTPIITNYDCLASKTTDEMATTIASVIDCKICQETFGHLPCDGRSCTNVWRDWLKQEATP